MLHNTVLHQRTFNLIKELSLIITNRLIFMSSLSKILSTEIVMSEIEFILRFAGKIYSAIQLNCSYTKKLCFFKLGK